LDFREKDTAIILFCCILIVLLVVFFLSERRKFTLNNIDSSQEGAYDTYKLTVSKFFLKKTGGNKKEKILAASWDVKIERVLLAVGADLRGEVMVKIQSAPTRQSKAYFTKNSHPVDLNTEFLPEGSCNFSFFDSDLVNFRGGLVRKGERWKYIRPLSLYGEKELNTEIYYTFTGKTKKGEDEFGKIEFEAASKRWIEKGLNSVDKITGTLLIHDQTGKLEMLEYSYTKHNERQGFYFSGKLELVNSAVITKTKLKDMREEFESPEPKVEIVHKPKTGMVRMTASGDKNDLEKKFRFLQQSSSEYYTVQIRVFSGDGDGRERAQMLKEHLRSRKYNVFILEEGNMYKVCTGKYLRDEKMLQERLTVLKAYFPDAFIKKLPSKLP
jgi:hypothetical protein